MSEEAIDVNEVLERVQNDKDLLLELFDIFQEDYLVKRKAITDLVEKKDFEQLKGIAHSLKGASGNISAKKVHVLFYQLEEIAKNADLSQAREILANLDKEYVVLEFHIAKLKKDFKK